MRKVIRRVHRALLALLLPTALLLAVTPAAAAPPPHRGRHQHRGGRHRPVMLRPAQTLPVTVVQTTHDLGEALRPQPSLRFGPVAPPVGTPVVTVDDNVQLQRFTGVGGAMTDSSAWLIWDELPAHQRAALMDDLFASAGARLSFLRVPMGASDFTATESPYSYDDLPAGETDPSLTHFSIAHDEPYILPALRAAEHLNPPLYLEAVPWSPPAWMKTNDALANNPTSGSLLPSAYPELADYFVKFLQDYAQQGVHISAVSPQNEPDVQTLYPGLELSDAQEAQFVAGDLRPALSAARLSPAVFGWDLSWAPLTTSDPLVGGPRSAAPFTGLAWHCYAGTPAMMSAVQAVSPGMQQIVDECTTGSGDLWSTSEALIASFRNDADAVALWNLALDPQGGPVQPPNWGCGGCTGVATVDPQTHTFSLSQDYYELAQLSHFVAPGAIRIGSNTFVSYGLTPSYQPSVSTGLDDVAFQNLNGSEVLFAYNNSPAPITFAVRWRGGYVTDTVPPGATTTFTWG